MIVQFLACLLDVRTVGDFCVSCDVWLKDTRISSELQTTRQDDYIYVRIIVVMHVLSNGAIEVEGGRQR